MDSRQERQHLSRNLSRHLKALSQDNTVRPMVAIIDLAMGDRGSAPIASISTIAISRPTSSSARQATTLSSPSPAPTSSRFATPTRSGFVNAIKEAGLCARSSVLSAQRLAFFVHGSLAQAHRLRHDRHPDVGGSDDEEGSPRFPRRRQGEAQSPRSYWVSSSSSTRPTDA